MNRMKTTVLIAAGIFAGIFLSSPAAQALEEPSVVPIVQQFCLDGRTIDLTVYTVNGEEYVKLSDVSQKLNLSNSNTTTDTPYPMLPAVPAPTAGATANAASNIPAGITVAPDGTITAKTILCDAWSKEDYIQAANPLPARTQENGIPLSVRRLLTNQLFWRAIMRKIFHPSTSTPMQLFPIIPARYSLPFKQC